MQKGGPGKDKRKSLKSLSLCEYFILWNGGTNPMNKTITAAGAPAASGPYCHAKLAGNMLFISGQLGVDPATGAMGKDVSEQATLALKNLGVILKAADMDYTDVVKTTVFLADINDFATINAIYADVFNTEAPARSCFQVANLPKAALFEIEAIAVKG